MKKKRALAASRMPDDYAVEQNGPIYTIRDPALEPNSIIFNIGAADEMLRVTKDGFYVRGVRVPADDREAETVYNAFKEFLTYHALARSY
jgi:hypothetical protein